MEKLEISQDERKGMVRKGTREDDVEWTEKRKKREFEMSFVELDNGEEAKGRG